MSAPEPSVPARPKHAPCDWPLEDGRLQVGGIDAVQLAERVGATPLYAYDDDRIAARIRALRAALPAAVGLHYAVKANPFAPLLRAIAPRVDGFDVASAGELAMALVAGMAPEHISIAGPAKRAAELAASVEAGVLVNVESMREVPLLADASSRCGRAARVALRINPDHELKGSGMRMGGGAKPFGVDAEQAPAVLAAIAAHGLAFEGLHIFAGSQSLDAQAIAASQQASLALAERLAPHLPAPLRVLNLGGGFGIPYFPGEARIALEPIGAALDGIAQRLAASLGPQARAVLELGRYLVGEAGVYLTRIIDRKQSRGRVFLVCDGGLHHHLAAAGLFGQVLRKNYPLALAHAVDAPPAESVQVVGPLCTPLDVLGDAVALPAAQPGDLIAVFQSGAYGASASPQAFLAQGQCREVLVRGGRIAGGGSTRSLEWVE